MIKTALTEISSMLKMLMIEKHTEKSEPTEIKERSTVRDMTLSSRWLAQFGMPNQNTELENETERQRRKEGHRTTKTRRISSKSKKQGKHTNSDDSS